MPATAIQTALHRLLTVMSSPAVPAVLSGVLLGGAASHAQECPGTGDCLEPHEMPGCSDVDCCGIICDLDPFCCESWDLTCATLADVSCPGLCGAQASGSCFAPNGSPACDDRNCCETVCISDPFCCSGSWDANCALFAGFFCEVPGGECGESTTGDCFEANGSPACSDADCCDAVCTIDTTCCDLNWDAICVALAEEACLEPCIVGIGAEDAVETEGCDGTSNDPCDGGVAEPWSMAAPIHGTFRDAEDRDVLLVDLAPDDLDGDGQVRLRLRFTSTAGALTLRTTPCGTGGLEITSVACIQSETIACVDAGPMEIEIRADGTPPLCDEPGWRLELEIADTCDEACGNDRDCLLAHAEPGCEDGDCCDLVCAEDPLCCDWAWDAPCAVFAATLCGGPPPANDTCETAVELDTGVETDFRQLLSTSSGPDPSCLDPARRGGDVWFRYVSRCDDTVRIGTCSTANFDTVVDVFTGECGDLVEVSCIDDEGFCLFGTGSVLFDADCGESYLVRVSGVDAQTGSGSILAECFGVPCPCAEDLDGNGTIDGADLGMLFVEWGACPKGCEADFDDDGVVGGADLGMLFAAWGDC